MSINAPDVKSTRHLSKSSDDTLASPLRENRTLKDSSGPTKSNHSENEPTTRPFRSPCMSLSAEDQCTEITAAADSHAASLSTKLSFDSEERTFLSLARILGLERAVVVSANYHLRFQRPLLALLEGLNQPSTGNALQNPEQR